MSATAAALPADQALWQPRVSPWVIAVSVTLATFMEVLDTSIKAARFLRPQNASPWQYTIEREYGSGGSVIAKKLGARLGWKVWESLTQEITRVANVDPTVAQRCDERVDP